MDVNYSPHQRPRLRVLSDEQIQKIYGAALECLQRTGVTVRNEEARWLLEQAGADIDSERVRIPAHIVQEALATTPRSFTIWGRDGHRHIQCVPDKVHFGPGPTCTFFIDPWTGERRKTRRGDPAMTALVCDALPHIDYVMSLGLIDDVTPSLASVYEYAEMLANTTKPILPWGFRPAHVSDIYQMALAVVGSEEAFRRRPILAFFSTWQAPLTHTEEDLANVMWAVAHDIPVVYIGGGAAGMTAPITGAGLLVAYLAGALSGLAILQLKKKGAAVCIGGVPEPMDLRTARPAYGGPEMSLYSAAMADISRYLGVPFQGTAGASESKLPDPQAAIESTLQVLMSGLSGATLVHDVGFLDCADIGSLEMLVMVDEIVAMTRRIMRGIEVNDETIMLDVIDAIGPGGEYMSHPTTAKLCRREIWQPTLMDRNPYVMWEAEGAFSMNERIRQKLRMILQTHCVAPLTEEAHRTIQRILEKAEAREGTTRQG